MRTLKVFHHFTMVVGDSTGRQSALLLLPLHIYFAKSLSVNALGFFFLIPIVDLNCSSLRNDSFKIHYGDCIGGGCATKSISFVVDQIPSSAWYFQMSVTLYLVI